MFFKHTKWAIIWALFILILCGIPGRDIPHISFLELLSFDKFVHAGIFFVLMLLTIRGFMLQTYFPLLQHFPQLIAFIFCIIYGGVLEIMQESLFVERTADIYDFIANSFGSAIGLILYNRIQNKVLVRLIN
jgi:VanZ family protein